MCVFKCAYFANACLKINWYLVCILAYSFVGYWNYKPGRISIHPFFYLYHMAQNKFLLLLLKQYRFQIKSSPGSIYFQFMNTRTQNHILYFYYFPLFITTSCRY